MYNVLPVGCFTFFPPRSAFLSHPLSFSLPYYILPALFFLFFLFLFFIFVFSTIIANVDNGEVYRTNVRLVYVARGIFITIRMRKILNVREYVHIRAVVRAKKWCALYEGRSGEKETLTGEEGGKYAINVNLHKTNVCIRNTRMGI